MSLLCADELCVIRNSSACTAALLSLSKTIAAFNGSTFTGCQIKNILLHQEDKSSIGFPHLSSVDNYHRNVTSVRTISCLSYLSDKEAAHCLSATSFASSSERQLGDCLTPKNGSAEKKAICPHLFHHSCSPLIALHFRTSLRSNLLNGLAKAFTSRFPAAIRLILRDRSVPVAILSSELG